MGASAQAARNPSALHPLRLGCGLKGVKPWFILPGCPVLDLCGSSLLGVVQPDNASRDDAWPFQNKAALKNQQEHGALITGLK